LCFFDINLKLTDVISKGYKMMKNNEIVKCNYYENCTDK